MNRPSLTLTLTLALLPSRLVAADPSELKDGDRVVFVGSTLVEREQKTGYWELALTLKNRDKNVTFRNLGWSGDTVWAESRGRFDYANPAKCFDQLVSLTKKLKPTVVVVCYGQNESFDGKAGVEKFRAGLDKLIDALADTKARVVLMSPTPFEKGPGLPDPSARNADLALYRDAIRATAEKRGLEFVDLFEKAKLWDVARDSAGPVQLTENGVHLTPDGYQVTAGLLAGVRPSADELLRQKIVEKNQLFFYNWRPQNETYLFGFRKHEQGQNAKEVDEFEPLVAAVEKEIAELKKAVK